jgi:predicted porin
MMKKILTAIMSATTMIASSAYAGDVTVYGKINLSYNQIEKDQAGNTTQDNWELETLSSRVGVKGSETITDDLNVIYKLEYQIVPDGEGGDNEFKARNSYVGLQGSYGTILAGNHDTPLKMSQGKVDVFNDYSLGDIALSLPGERRENDIIIYSAPKLGDVSLSLGIMPGDDSGEDCIDCNDDDNGFADQISAAAVYKGESVYAALAIDNNVNGLDIIRLSSSYDFGSVIIGVMYQQAEDSDTSKGKGLRDNVKGAIKDALNNTVGFIAEDQDSFLISAAWNINEWTLKAQYIDSTYENSLDSLDNTSMGVGIDYTLSKRTKLYSHYNKLTVDKNISINLSDDYEYTGLGVIGIEHKF